jgi:hypothetical protein
VRWPSCIAFYDPKRKIIVDKGSSRACGKNYNRFSIHAEQRAIEYCRSCDKRDKYEIYIWRYSRDGNIKPAKCCNACMKLAEKYNYKNRIFTFNNENIETAISDNPGISLGYKIKYNL